MEEYVTIREYFDHSKQCLSVKRIVCKEMLREGADKPDKIARFGIASAAWDFQKLTEKLQKQRQEHERGTEWITAGKAATNLTLVGATTVLVALLPTPVGGAVIAAGAIIAISNAGKIMLSDFSFDHVIKQKEKEFNKHADQIVANDFQRRFAQNDARLKELSQQIEDKEKTPQDAIDELLKENDVFSSNSILKDIHPDQKPEMLYQMTKAVERRAKDLASFLNDRVDNIETRVTKLEKRSEQINEMVKNHIKETNRQIGEISQHLENVGNQITAINGQVISNSNHITENAQDIQHLQGFIFENMSPEQQIRALDSGFFKGLPAGDKDKLKIKAETAKEQKELVGTLNTMAASAALAGRVSELLDAPEDVQRAISVAGTAFNAAAQFASGNYIGAAMSALSLFGKKKRTDPAAARHKQVMKSLNKVLENQGEIFKGIDALAENQGQLMKNQHSLMKGLINIGNIIEKNHKVVMDKLNAIHVDVLYNRVILSDLVRQGLDDGRNFLKFRSDEGHDYANGQFPSYEHQRGHFNSFAHTKFWPCWSGLERVFRIDNRVHSAIQMASNDGQRVGTTKNFRETLLQPAIDLLFSGYQGNKLNTAILGLISPYQKVSTLEGKLDDIAKIKSSTQPGFNIVAAYLKTPVDPDIILEYGRAAIDMHEYFPLMKTSADDENKLKTLFELKQEGETTNSRGKELLEDYRRYVALAIAQQSLIAGDGIITLAYEQVEKKHKGEDAPLYDKVMDALEYNLIFRQNFAIYLMQKELPKTNNNELSYRFVYESGFKPTNLLSGNKWKFEVNDNKKWALRLRKKEMQGEVVVKEKILLELPHPTALAQGVMRHTPDTPQLMAMIRSVAEALMEYDHEWRDENLTAKEKEVFEQLIVYSVEHLVPDPQKEQEDVA